MTPSSTQVYPSKSMGNYIDGSNLNISKHQCIEFA